MPTVPPQDNKDGAIEEEEKQAENGKKEEERGREQEGEREADKTESEMGENTYPSQTLDTQRPCVIWKKKRVFFPSIFRQRGEGEGWKRGHRGGAERSRE